MMKFFITSQGRTGTKWLAYLMDRSPTWFVGHETTSRAGCALANRGLVSSSHIQHLDGSPHMPFHESTKLGAIIRDPNESCLSAANKMQKMNEADRAYYLKRWVLHMSKCFTIMDKVLEDGALPINYYLFNDVGYVQGVLEHFGIDDVVVTEEDLMIRRNTYEPTYDDIKLVDPRTQKAAADSQWFYSKWKDKC
jgi:hypothetical protein